MTVVRTETYLQATKRLAEAHRKRDRGIKEVWSFPDPNERRVRLVEVTESVPYGGRVLPFRFSAQPGPCRRPYSDRIPFPSTIILLHPTDWRRIKEHRLRLPKMWDLKTMRRVPLPHR